MKIKNMVCARCLKIVRQVMEKLELQVNSIELGEVVIDGDLPVETIHFLRQELQREGFDLIDDQKAKLVEAVKNLVIEKVHYSDLDEMRENFSDYISSKLHRDYTYLSNLFSQTENTTIEQFVILQKVEKIKELLVYNEIPVNEIAFKLGYSSQAHLSNQFKKITGLSPSFYKQLKNKRKAIL